MKAAHARTPLLAADLRNCERALATLGQDTAWLHPEQAQEEEEARRQAEAEGLTLVRADSSSGYEGVVCKSGMTKPYQVQVSRGGKNVSLGYFTTAEEAALCFARTPEGRSRPRSR